MNLHSKVRSWESPRGGRRRGRRGPVSKRTDSLTAQARELHVAADLPTTSTSCTSSPVRCALHTTCARAGSERTQINVQKGREGGACQRTSGLRCVCTDADDPDSRTSLRSDTNPPPYRHRGSRWLVRLTGSVQDASLF